MKGVSEFGNSNSVYIACNAWFNMKLENVKLYIVALVILQNIAIDMKEEVDFLVEPILSESEQMPRPENDSRSRRLFNETYFNHINILCSFRF